MECPKAKTQPAENSVPLADACCGSWPLLLGHISKKMPLLDVQNTQLFQAGEALKSESGAAPVWEEWVVESDSASSSICGCFLYECVCRKDCLRSHCFGRGPGPSPLDRRAQSPAHGHGGCSWPWHCCVTSNGILKKGASCV